MPYPKSQAKDAGKAFGKQVLNYFKHWEGSATIIALAGYITSKEGMKIGKTQFRVGLGMLTTGLIAEIIILKKQYPEFDIRQLNDLATEHWIESVQPISSAILLIGIIHVMKELKSSETAFIIGAISTITSLTPKMLDKLTAAAFT